MKSIKYGIMLLAAFASFSSCDEHDFLKEEPLDFIRRRIPWRQALISNHH